MTDEERVAKLEELLQSYGRTLYNEDGSCKSVMETLGLLAECYKGAGDVHLEATE